MYRRSRAHYTRPPCLSFKRAFSAPVPQVAFVTRRTALRRRREPAFLSTSLYPDPLLRSRPACARTARSARPDPRVTQFDLRVPPNFLLSVLCAPLFVRRSSQCDWFSPGAGALHAKGHERPLGDLAFPWRARERPASRGRVPVDPKTIQEYNDVLPFRSRHLHQITLFLRDCRHQF